MLRLCIISWVLLANGTSISSCTLNNSSEVNEKPVQFESKNRNQKSFRILALGDSYTIGEGVPEDERWPVQLTKLLNNAGYFVEEPQIIARTGWTTDELLQGIRETNIVQAPAGSEGLYDIVTLLIGVNNQYRGRDLEEYRRQLDELLKLSVEFAGGNPARVIVLSIPDWGVTPFATGQDSQRIANEIDAFNRINYQQATKAGANYVDVTPISRKAAKQPDLIATDGLHPSGKMYSEWAHLVLPKAIEILNP